MEGKGPKCRQVDSVEGGWDFAPALALEPLLLFQELSYTRDLRVSCHDAVSRTDPQDNEIQNEAGDIAFKSKSREVWQHVRGLRPCGAQEKRGQVEGSGVWRPDPHLQGSRFTGGEAGL